jgi:hypothetical protein
MTKNEKREKEDGDGKEDSENGRTTKKKGGFNSAEYLFVSHRLASSVMDNESKVANMILSFTTPWPKQSYQHIDDVSKNYDRKFSALGRSFSMIILFFLSSLLSVPPSIQDMIVQMSSTTVLGYTLLLHLQLYQIFPILIVVPTFFAGMIIHFYLQSNKGKKKLEAIQFMKEVKGLNEEKNKSKQQQVPAIVVVEGDSFVHKRRRESIQEGISVAKKLDNIIYKKKTILLKKDAVEGGDVHSDGSSSFELVSSVDDDELDHHQDINNCDIGSGDSDVISSLSDENEDENEMLENHRKAFLAKANNLQQLISRPPPPLVHENDSLDDEEEDLYNLHLAINHSSKKYPLTTAGDNLSDDESCEDDSSFDDEEQLQTNGNQPFRPASLSNSSVTSILLTNLLPSFNGGSTTENLRRKSYTTDVKQQQEEDEQMGFEDDEDDDLVNLHLQKPSSLKSQQHQQLREPSPLLQQSSFPRKLSRAAPPPTFTTVTAQNSHFDDISSIHVDEDSFEKSGFSIVASSHRSSLLPPLLKQNSGRKAVAEKQ